MSNVVEKKTREEWYGEAADYSRRRYLNLDQQKGLRKMKYKLTYKHDVSHS